jgi:hypothetical protein
LVAERVPTAKATSGVANTAAAAADFGAAAAAAAAATIAIAQKVSE